MPLPVLRRTLALLSAAALAGCDGTGPDPLASVEISPDTAYVTLNTTARLDATARSERGRTLTGMTFAWSSSDTSVAAVSADGTVAARKYGIATITASTEGAAGSATVWVTGGPGLTVVTEPRDTIGVVAAEPLVAELREEDGRPRAGARVRFEAMPISPLGPPAYRARFEEPVTGGAVGSRTVATDAQGRASVRVRMGDAAGPASIVVHDEARGVADTVQVTVLAGAAAEVRLEPADTAVFIGRTVQMRAGVHDRAGNPTSGTVSLERVDGPLGMDGGLVSTPAYGASRIVARMGGLADTARVASVPIGAIAVSTLVEVVMMNLDGTVRRSAGEGISPTWSPDGRSVVFARGGELYLFRQGTPGGAAQPLVPPPAGWENAWPQYSLDGEWVYYYSRRTISIWRVRPNGTGKEMVGDWWMGHPSASPDGSRMAYFYGFEGGPPSIRVMDLATRQASADLAPGHTPTWSPTGELIAFSELDPDGTPAGIMVMRPDGSGVRRVTPPGARYGLSPRWSPDGRWIVASHAEGGVHLIQLETGLVIELPFRLEDVEGVSWRPGGRLP